jgi:hypothetical protein
VTKKAGSFNSGEATVTNTRGERTQLLGPVDRISVTPFGPIMAVTIVGSLSIANAGHARALIAGGRGNG